VAATGAGAVGLALLLAPDEVVAAEVDDIALGDAGGFELSGGTRGDEHALEALGGLVVAEVGHLRQPLDPHAAHHEVVGRDALDLDVALVHLVIERVAAWPLRGGGDGLLRQRDLVQLLPNFARQFAHPLPGRRRDR
jgi:hypothetical protein